MPECPVCHSSDIHRSRSRFWIRRWLKSSRAFRCRACGHHAAEVMHSSRSGPVDCTLRSRSLDLAEIDKAFDEISDDRSREIELPT